MLNSEDISADHIKSGFGGYKKKATREYLDSLREEYDTLYKENIELKDKLSVLSEGVQYYKNMEKSLQKALVLAERTTSETIHAAEVKAMAMENEAKSKAEVFTKEAQMKASNYEKEAALKADAMIREAKQQADSAIAEGNEELRSIHSQIMALIQQYEQYKSQYKQLALAQMNVLESEAYTLDAPILKTIRGKLDELQGGAARAKQEEEHIAERVVNPVPTVSDPKEDIGDSALNDQEADKKMYMDGRGQLYEVHDFREVSISGNMKDEFGDFSKSKKEEFDDFSAASVPEVEKKQPDEYFKAFETPDTKQASESVEKNTVLDDDHEKLGHVEQEEDPYAAMKRIEKMQLERLRREEEQHAELLRNQKSGYEYENQNFEEKLSMDMDTSAQTTSYQEEPEMILPNNEQVSQSKDDYLSMLHKDDDEPINLSDLKHMEMENQNEIPLPKASEEKDYFSEFPKEMEAVSFEESPEETFEETSSANYSSNKEPEYRFSKAHTYGSEAEKNSLSYEMDHGSQIDNKGKEREGFKSFRDFESEL